MRTWAFLLVLPLVACVSRGKSAPGETGAKEPVTTEAEGQEASPSVRFAFEGLQELKERHLLTAARRELDAYSKKKRRLADAADAAYSMELYCRDEGYAHAKVGFAVEPEGLVFTVEEGPLVRLGPVRLEGVAQVPYEELEPLVAFESGGFKAPVFREAEVRGAAGEIESAYLLRGYLRVNVARPVVTFSEDRAEARVLVRIEEGPQYIVERVEFEGIAHVPDDGATGEPYHVRVPAQLAGKIRRFLLDRGHQRLRVSGSAVVDHERARAVVRIQATPGPVVRLRSLAFEGRERTRENFLRERIPIEVGDIVAQHLLDRGLDNLFSSGLFQLVRPRLAPAGDAEADLSIELKELLARTVDFEVGYGSYEQARAAVRYRDRNLFGLARTLEVEARVSLKSYATKVLFKDPFVLGDKNTLEIGVGYLAREEPSFDLEAIDFDLIVSRDFDGPYDARFGYRMRFEDADDAPPDEQAGFIRTAGLFLAVRRDTRDSLVLPTAGSLVRLGVLWSSPTLGADLEFLELDFRATRHVRLSDRAVLAVGTRLRTREILNNDANLPIQERLFLGGESSVRSFGESELGPFDANRDPLGGLTALEAHIELRVRTWRDLHVAGFLDAGNIAVDAFSFDGPPGYAVGLGFRYYLPVGPIRLDFGYNPGRLFAADQAWALHLAFGFSF